MSALWNIVEMGIGAAAVYWNCPWPGAANTEKSPNTEKWGALTGTAAGVCLFVDGAKCLFSEPFENAKNFAKRHYEQMHDSLIDPFNTGTKTVIGLASGVAVAAYIPIVPAALYTIGAVVALVNAHHWVSSRIPVVAALGANPLARVQVENNFANQGAFQQFLFGGRNFVTVLEAFTAWRQALANQPTAAQQNAAMRTILSSFFIANQPMARALYQRLINYRNLNGLIPCQVYTAQGNDGRFLMDFSSTVVEVLEHDNLAQVVGRQ